MVMKMENKENYPSSQIINLETVTEFLLKNNGKVKQSTLLNHFRKDLSNPSTKVRVRQEFKDILQLITAAKTENGEKYFILIQQNQEHSQILVSNRRSLAQRKELARSRYEYARTSPPGSDEEDSGSPNHHGSSGTISSQDSGIASEISELSSMTSVQLLRTSLADKIPSTRSMDSIEDALMIDGDDDSDLEDDLGLNDGIEVLDEEKKWMLAASHGHLDKLTDLFKTYPHLVKKKGFLLGYTALHWAAKLGRPDIVKFIISSGGDITSKSHGGYSPLHLAALSGKDQVIIQLIELYGANVHARDNSGKKPKDLVKETVAADVQRKLGRTLILEPDWVRTDALIERKMSRQQTYIPPSNISPKDKRKHSKLKPEIYAIIM